MAAISADRLACRKQEIRRRARLDLAAHGVLRPDPSGDADGGADTDADCDRERERDADRDLDSDPRHAPDSELDADLGSDRDANVRALDRSGPPDGDREPDRALRLASAAGTRLDLARLLERPPLLWRVADHLLDLLPGEIRTSVEIVAGVGTGGLLLGHVMSALLDGRRPLAAPAVRFAMFETTRAGGPRIAAGAAAIVRGQDLLIVAAEASADDRRACLQLARAAGARVLAFAAIGGDACAARDARDPPAYLLCEDLRAGGPRGRGLAWCAEDA